jgi:hypothetical protein
MGEKKRDGKGYYERDQRWRVCSSDRGEEEEEMIGKK